MMNTGELRKVIVELIEQNKTSDYKVYYKRVPFFKVSYPYVTYYLSHSKREHEFNYSLELHVWTRDDVKLAEKIADEISNIDGFYYYDENNFSLDFYLQSRKTVDDEDKEIVHEVLLFNIIVYDKK